MTNKTFAAVANYRARQLKELTDYLPVNAGDVGAIADRLGFASAAIACRNDTIAAYAEVFGPVSEDQRETMLRLWEADDTPAVTLVASMAVADPAEPRLAITAGADDLDAKWERFMAASTEDVPGPVKDASPPASSTEDPPTGAAGPGTQDDGDDDDNALD